MVQFVGNASIFIIQIFLRQPHTNSMLDTACNLLTLFSLTFLGWVKHTTRYQEQKIDHLTKQIHSAKYYHHDLSNGKPEEMIDFKRLKEQPRRTIQVLLVVPQQKIQHSPSYVLAKSPIYFRQDIISWNPSTRFMEDKLARDFLIQYQGKQIKVDPRQCNIMCSVLTQQEIDIPVVPGKEAKYKQKIYSFNKLCSMVLVGSLGYNLDQQQFHLIPSFILSAVLPNRKVKNYKEYFQFLKQYIDQRQSSIRIPKGLILLSLLLIVSLHSGTLVKGFYQIKRLYRRLIDWKQDRQPKLEDRNQIFASPEDKLKCPCGKTLNVIYDCGHLAICIACHEEAIDNRCRICGKAPNKIQRIFT